MALVFVSPLELELELERGPGLVVASLPRTSWEWVPGAGEARVARSSAVEGLAWGSRLYGASLSGARVPEWQRQSRRNGT